MVMKATESQKKKKKGAPQSSDGLVGRVRLPKRGELLGEVEQLLGDRRMTVRCTDKNVRLCRIPGKIRRRIWIKEGNIVLVEPWEVQADERGDILWRYTIQQADWLEKKGFLKGLEE